MKNFITKILKYITVLIRKFNFRIDKTPTILTPNCIAGVVYHDLGLKFMSPTVNLYMNINDYFRYVMNLEKYQTGTIYENTNTDKSFPVGTLRAEGVDDIELYFMHYNTFEAAKIKWEERSKRIDTENIVIILPLINEESVDTLLEKFDELPYKKVALVTEEYKDHPNTFVYTQEIYDRNGNENLLSYRKDNKVLKWRYLDYFDYAKFLKTGEIKSRKL